MAKFDFKEDMFSLIKTDLRQELDEDPPFSAGMLDRPLQSPKGRVHHARRKVFAQVVLLALTLP